ncbi:MAG: alpha/beta fold hydrolase [Opitutales bacterium]
MPVELFHRLVGEPSQPPLIVLHGLLGSSRNWATTARDLAQTHAVYLLDLRNHGQSPHATSMQYADLAADVAHWLDTQAMETVDLIGHSLGGKVAMRLACDTPERARRLVVADIAPRDYPPHFAQEFAALNALDLTSLQRRKAAEDALEAAGIDDWAMRAFLLTNLVGNADEGFRWQVNLEALTQALEVVAGSSLTASHRFEGPALFVRGAQSNFVRDADQAVIRKHFPVSRLETIADAAHNVHVQNRNAFVQTVQRFLAGDAEA